MGSTSTPLKHQKSVKFHMDEKPSIKITVSSDALAETLLKSNVSSSSSEDDESSRASPQPALIQIVGNCCASSSGGDVLNPPKNGVLCNCANGDDKRTRIALDDFTVLEFPNCVDFGIKDFLCCKDEIELDLSSDTDASYLDATPPHRFSDSELENQIEAMSITLDTQLNPFPNKGGLTLMDSGNPLSPDEETTEESFIMDEEEMSSSASNSAATICGGGGGGDLEHDDHLSVTSSDLVMQGDQPNNPFPLTQDDSVDDAFQYSISAEEEFDANAQSIKINDADACIESNEANLDGATTQEPSEDIPEVEMDCGETEMKLEEETEQAQRTTEEYTNTSSRSVEDTTLETETRSPPSGNNANTQNDDPVQKEAEVPMSRKMLKHPTKHFKRQISLPASIFMSYLLEQNNKANHCCKQSLHNSDNDNLNHHHHHHPNNADIIVKNKLNRSNSCSKKYNMMAGNNIGVLAGIRPPLSKIDSYRSTKVIHGSTEDYDDEDINNSNSFSDTCDTTEDYMGALEQQSGVSSIDDAEDNSSLLGCNNKQSNWTWESKSDSFTETDDPQEEFDDEQQAFTSEIEKRSLILRHVRRLIRQDTTGNFAPPDFSI